jgi:two-component system, NtrC family, nitrogen regulation response regulator NtrX
MKPRILVIDDEAAIRDSLRMILEYENYEFSGAASGPDGLAQIKRDPPDMVVLDIKMPGTNGLETLADIRKVDESLPVAMISGHGTITDAMQATRLGAFDFIEKPFTSERVLVTVQKGLELRSLRRENRELKLAMEAKYEIVGNSATLRKVLEAVQRAAPTNATVMLLGESGVGKELVARTIHRNSPRAGQRFIQVNCAAIPEELIESELFGHEKGSFTGAAEKQIGKFELAHKGTIFLDEIGDMSLRTQAKVLRVLQEGEVERIGSQKTIQVDVRVIAATNKKLEDAIERGEFREDLYFRLSVIPIRVPPLRERSEDVVPLVEHFVQAFSADNNFKPKTFTPAAMEILRKHPWRGNVRELRNTIERLLIMVEGPEIRPEHLEEVLLGPTEGASPASSAPEPPGSLKDFKETAERAFLVQKLRESRWNISATAQAIGTPRSNLYKKLEQYGISQEKDG